MSIKYRIDNEIEQTIAMKINEELAFPDQISIVRAELYTFNKKPRAKVWKDGTGKVSREWSFPAWMRIYDKDGYYGEGTASPEVWKIFLPMMLKDNTPRTNLEWRRLFYWKERAAVGTFRAMSQIEMMMFDLLARKKEIPLHRMLGAK